MENKINKNPWTPEDEGDHYPSMKEWWVVETLFETLDDGKKWSFKGSMAYELETPSCFIVNLLFDINSNKCVLHKAFNDDVKKFIHKKNKLDLSYENFIIEGLYPNYHLRTEDKKMGFVIDIKLKAKIVPHWSAQDSTNGYLPIGFDHYRYGWLLNFDVTGFMKLNDQVHEIKGEGYMEHAFGNWSYSNPFKRLSGIKKTISAYINLFGCRFLNFSPKIPDRISFATENNPFGYDWFWGVFDNDWSVFYGNSLFWLTEGPAFGVLTLFTEGNNYLDFYDINFRYNKTIYIKEYDLYYPSDITLIAKLGDKKIELRVFPVCDPYEYIDEFKGSGFYRAFIMSEIPGRMEGVYKDHEKEMELKGECKIVPQRQTSKLGHNSLTINFLKPPKGVGVSFDLDSHYLNKKIFTKIQLAPRPKISLYRR